jgi:hypothetical protein
MRLPLGAGIYPELNLRISSHAFFQEPHLGRVVDWILWLAVLGVLAAIPFKIVSDGFTPEDDALRHVAKAISGRSWQQILLMRPEIGIDQHAGWHWILGFLHNAFGWEQDALLIFSCTSLAILFLMAGLPWVRFPELWIAALMAVLPFCTWIPRLMIGRPLMVSATVVVTLLFLWTKSGKIPPRYRLAISFLLFGAAAWIHGSWYLFLLLIVPFFLAGEWRDSLSLSGSWLAGTAAAGCLAGNPWVYLTDQLQHLRFALAGSVPSSILVGEFQPGGGEPAAVVVVIGVLFIRLASEKPLPDLLKMPAFLMAAICWGLAFKNGRFWHDWGMPALLVWIIQIIEPIWADHLLRSSCRRLITGLFVSGVFFVSITSNLQDRWSNVGESAKLIQTRFARAPEWLPGPGGIVYNPNMLVFYELFHAFPDRDWRYVLGFEIGLMRKENLEVYLAKRKSGDLRALIPWTERMQTADRLILHLNSQKPPPLPMLQWHYFGRNWWIGRLPKEDPAPESVSHQTHDAPSPQTRILHTSAVSCRSRSVKSNVSESRALTVGAVFARTNVW